MATRRVDIKCGMQILIVWALMVVPAVTPVMANGVLWPISEGGNGHIYEPIAAGELIPWATADQIAREKGGYLATLTSEAENEFVFSLIRDDYRYWYVWFLTNHFGPWIGGYQLPGAAEPDQGWAWITGEPFAYEAWRTGEPSNTAGGQNEDRIHFAGDGRPQPFWNDQIDFEPIFGPVAFIVEYESIVFEAEDSEYPASGSIHTVLDGYSGTGYLTLDGQAEGAIQWLVHTSAVGAHTLLLRYANQGPASVPIYVLANGVAVAEGLLTTDAPSVGGWSNLSVAVYLNAGPNHIEIVLPRHNPGIALDKLTVLNETINLMTHESILLDSGEGDAAAQAHAVDGKADTYWYVDDFPQSLEVDLGDIYPLDYAQVAYRIGLACQYRIEVKADLQDDYTLVVDHTDYVPLTSDPGEVEDRFVATPTRYVRLTVTGKGDPQSFCTEIAEFRVGARPTCANITTPAGVFSTIQQAVDAAQDGDVVTIQPGLYTGPGNWDTDMRGKAITLTSSDPNDEWVVTRTIIKGHPDAPAITCGNNETNDCLLTGLTITGAQAGVFCQRTSPTLQGCRLVENLGAGIEIFKRGKPHIDNCLIAGNRHAGVYVNPGSGRGRDSSAPVIRNCTIADNLGCGVDGGNLLTVLNSIIWFNGILADEVQIGNSDPILSYCCLPGSWDGTGNISHDPLFVRRGVWESAITSDQLANSEAPNLHYVPGDYHLQSESGYWNPTSQTWLKSGMNSPCIDAGDPDSDWRQESMPHGDRINLGAYGGTSQASLSSSSEN